MSQISSKALFDRALKVIPGGVNSPVRAFQAVGGLPPVICRGEGAFIEDVEGRRYLDFVGSWGPLIMGHAHPVVVEAICEAVARGTTYGAPTPGEVALAEEVVSSYPGLEQIRCVSSGTEATMSAIRVARGFTGRELIVKFSGCYHGHADHLLVAAGSGLVTFGTPSSAGVPAAFAEKTRVVPLDDDEAIRRLFRDEGEQIACVILEPIPANNGLLVQRKEFLTLLREETTRAGALLIFDEVISGFRVGLGGAAERYEITPDMATFGKVIGGGLPVGAFGGRREIMKCLAPEGPVYQAGTLSGNPVAMAAGLATLRHLKETEGWTRLEALGQHLETVLAPVLKKAPQPVSLVRVGSIFWLSFDEGELPRAAEAIQPGGAEIYRGLFHSLLDQGINIAPSAYEVGFISLAHTEGDLEQLAQALDNGFRAISRT